VVDESLGGGEGDFVLRDLVGLLGVALLTVVWLRMRPLDEEDDDAA
jgi:hypothetical protein